MKYGKVFLKLILMCSLVTVIATGCTQKDKEPRNVLARVGGESIFEDDVVRRIRAAHGDVDSSKVDPDRWQKMVEAATETEIVEMLLLREAISKSFTVSDEEVDAAVRQTKDIFGVERYKEVLKERDASEEEYKEFLKDRMLINRYKDHLFLTITIDDDMLESYFEGHTESFKRPESARLEALIFEDFDSAGEISQRVQSGEDMEKLAGEFSSDERKIIFRRTRWIPYSEIPEEVRDLVQSGETGDIIKPAQVDTRIQIYKILEKRSEYIPPFEEVKEELKNSFVRREQQKILDDWYEAAKKKVTIEYIQ